MRALFWNIRGFGARGRRDQLKDLVRSNSIDFVGLVETFKDSFTPSELSAIVGMDRFQWQSLPASGHSGGILIGSNKDIFDFVAFDHGFYWASVVLSHRSMNALCEFIVVYGPADHSFSHLFLDELSIKLESCSLPTVIGGDFNLLRCPLDKNNDNFSWSLANAFNDFISVNAIRELPRGGARFTWSNHQANPIRSVLDRVFLCPSWDALFPRSSLVAKCIVGSDHTPLILDDGSIRNRPPTRFQFDASWMSVDGFVDIVAAKISQSLSHNPRSFGPLDDWQSCAYALRKFLRGWSRNRAAEDRRSKAFLENQILELDRTADSIGLSDDGWAVRYNLEAALLQLHHQAEIYWRQRGTLNWTLKGDAPTAYFFAIANGRRRRCEINSLLINGMRSTDQSVIMAHVVDFFSSLLGAKPPSGLSISPHLWSSGLKISPEENASLMIPLSDQEIWDVVNSANTNAASGPDGFSIPFFRKFWPQLKQLVCNVIQGFCLGTVDISRLNYAVISLIPKVKGADVISQFRPIALINNFAKFPSKGFANRLSPVAHRVISPFQSAFIKGRFILDGILSLHEIVHDLHVRKSKAIILKLDFEKAYDSVSWSFLRQILLAKGFDGAYVHRIMQLVSGGHTAVAVNGAISNFFANGRGLRQGDPASPVLFNFVADAFSCMLSKAARCGHIIPVVSHLLPEGVSHLQYADDTIILVELDNACIANLKFILLCFEAVSGLKINFAKSEVMVTGVDRAEALRVARLLNCSLGSFPFKYLGLPISPGLLHAKDFAPVVAKVGNRVLPWRGRYNTNAGKVALINSCLSSLPLFLMGFYRLTDGVHAGFDKHRGGFYWNSADNKRKYRLVKWQLMCKPKNLGGLGIINTRVMNICLLIKWWWKIMTVGADVLWFSILKAKYFPNSNPMFAPARRGSQFWKALVKVRPIFLEHVKFCVGNGSAVRFWLDWWSGDAPLAVSFPVLFSYCPNPQISIAEVAANNWDLAFRRALSPEELEEWQSLSALFPVLSEEADSVVWPLTASGIFSVKSLYSRLIGGTTSARFSCVWKSKVPPKIKIFLWQAFRGRLPSADQIKKRNGPGSEFCNLCGALENSNHIFFNCVLAKLVWSCVRSWLRVSWDPSSFADTRTLAKSLVGVTKRVFWVGLGALCWALWTIRNKFTIELTFPSKPADVLFKSCIFLQQWRLLTKEPDRDALDLLIAKIRASASQISGTNHGV